MGFRTRLNKFLNITAHQIKTITDGNQLGYRKYHEYPVACSYLSLL